MRVLFFIVLLLMLSGYLFVEFARFRGGKVARPGRLPYPGARLAIRFANGVLLLTITGFLAFWPAPWGEEPVTAYLVPALMVLRSILLLFDVGWVFAQFRSESRERRRAFVDEMLGLAAENRSERNDRHADTR